MPEDFSGFEEFLRTEKAWEMIGEQRERTRDERHATPVDEANKDMVQIDPKGYATIMVFLRAYQKWVNLQ